MIMNKDIGKKEIVTQRRVIQLFKNELGYRYLGNWEEETRSSPLETNLLKSFLKNTQGYSDILINRAIDKLEKEVNNLTGGIYEANKKIYNLLRYGVNVKDNLNEPSKTVWLINWKEPEKNDFAIAEEVTVRGRRTARPDLVIYVNGIALGVIELKRSSKGVREGVSQNLRNQMNDFIPKFFTTMQLLLAGNDTEGLRYGTIETTDKYYLKWKEESPKKYDYSLDAHLSILFQKERLLELVHDFVIFDKGTKKLCRPNQYFGIKAAYEHVRKRERGIIWHTQGSGKSLTMVWLTKWIRENMDDSRVLIITDREELDDQIEKLFVGVDEKIYRTSSGRDLIKVLNEKTEMLMCSLVHKFGRKSDEGDFDKYIQEIKNNIPTDFSAKGDLYVFVDECHRTQSGRLNEAMKIILPDALFIGFTGTPLLKHDKKKSIEIFGPYIGEPYRFDEAVEDGVVLDLLYEARDVEQYITDQDRIDEWFDAKTKGLTDVAKVELKKRWGNIQKVLGSKSRLEKIVGDILFDFNTKPRLSTGEGNAMLVSGSVYQACRYFDLFQQAGFKECAIITSYEPMAADLRGEVTGEGVPTDELMKYEIYQKMLNGKSTEDYEAEAKAKFIDEPSKMKLLIVVDKLLTGFDAPSATYLYIDKSMRDHGLFQAICRVNRVHTEDKEYGYIVDYKDLFSSLQNSINDYTSAAFDQYEQADVSGLLKDRLKVNRDRLETALEKVKAYCEPVHPQDEPAFIRYFCGNTEYPEEVKEREELRVKLYQGVASLIRAFAESASELVPMGFSDKEISQLKADVKYYSELRDTIKIASGDGIDLKSYEPGMRQLMDMYIDAKSSRKISNFENNSLIDLIVNISDPRGEYKSKNKEAVAETIVNNVRKVINDERQTNPKYFNSMSLLLNEIIKARIEEVDNYEQYLKRILELADRVTKPENSVSYPSTLNSRAKQALYDNLDENEDLALRVHQVILENKLDGFRDGGIKEKKLMLAVNIVLNDLDKTSELMEIIKAQNEY